MAVQTDALLIRAAEVYALPGAHGKAKADIVGSAEWFAGLAAAADASPRAVWSVPESLLYLYLHLPESRSVESADIALLEQALLRALPSASQVSVSRLSRAFDMPGASAADQPVFHYVVETDPEAGWADEIARWYDNEHMPGLAAVPGCVRASRFLNHDHGPLSYACYDLVTRETLGSAPWLAVRNTDWSSRTRPHFTNTRRTMFTLPERCPDSGLL